MNLAEEYLRALRGETLFVYKRTRRKRSEFPMTETELKLMAAAAKIGLSVV